MNKRVRKAVFPAAGLGTRFLPATKAQPKEMLPIVDKPIIQYGVEEALTAGCDQIIIVTGRGKSAIEDHFDVSYELEKMLEERGKTELLSIVRPISDMLERTPLGAGGELQLTDGLRMLLEKEKIYGFEFDGKRHDAGDKLGFLKATVEFALKRAELGPQFREYLKTLNI